MTLNLFTHICIDAYNVIILNIITCDCYWDYCVKLLNIILKKIVKIKTTLATIVPILLWLKS